jgi:hypothetical protein
MCSEAGEGIANLGGTAFRDALHSDEIAADRSWAEILNVRDTSGHMEAMMILNEAVDGVDHDRFSGGDVVRALERELKLLLCKNDPKYKELRQEIVKTKAAARQIGVAVASAIAAQWKLSAGLVTPFVLVFLLGVCQVGINAWCAGKPIE